MRKSSRRFACRGAVHRPFRLRKYRGFMLFSSTMRGAIYGTVLFLLLLVVLNLRPGSNAEVMLSIPLQEVQPLQYVFYDALGEAHPFDERLSRFSSPLS